MLHNRPPPSTHIYIYIYICVCVCVNKCIFSKVIMQDDHHYSNTSPKFVIGLFYYNNNGNYYWSHTYTIICNSNIYSFVSVQICSVNLIKLPTQTVGYISLQVSSKQGGSGYSLYLTINQVRVYLQHPIIVHITPNGEPHPAPPQPWTLHPHVLSKPPPPLVCNLIHSLDTAFLRHLCV